jgi:hypothetical protein
MRATVSANHQEEAEASNARNAECMLPDNAPTETLLKALTDLDGAFERIDAAMPDIADILREREVSWVTIDEAPAVSQQAAWKRFGSPT